jgi:outer membrane immunogenic protein
VGGVEAGYNWQWGTNWLVGLEADFSASGMSGTNSATAARFLAFTQAETVQQQTDWFGTVRGRLGWLATPNLLLFGTGGFAYGRVSDSVTWGMGAPPASAIVQTIQINQFFATCAAGGVFPATNTCFAGSSSGVRTGWTAGGGLEYLLDQRWSAKIEYLFVDLGTHTVTAVNLPNAGSVPPPGTVPSSFNAVFHDRFNVVRLGLNYRF